MQRIEMSTVFLLEMLREGVIYIEPNHFTAEF